MAEVISRHNKQTSKKSDNIVVSEKKDCNCQKANLPCIMGGKCVPRSVFTREQSLDTTPAPRIITQVSVSQVGS